MDSKSVVDLIEASSGVHFSGFHMDGLEQRNTEVEQPTTSATDNFHKQPFVIGKFWLGNYVESCLACSYLTCNFVALLIRNFLLKKNGLAIL